MVEIEKQTKCQCLCECGKTIYVSSGNLRAKNYTSCGCRINQIGKENKRWKGCGEISGFIWLQIKRCCQSRKDTHKKIFDINIESCWAIFEKQNKKCALSGLPIKFAKTGTDHRKGKTTASLDRIDSSKGYVENNIQWVHKDINKLKSDFDQNKFKELCILVANESEKIING